jgi:hypothetical protein
LHAEGRRFESGHLHGTTLCHPASPFPRAGDRTLITK